LENCQPRLSDIQKRVLHIAPFENTRKEMFFKQKAKEALNNYLKIRPESKMTMFLSLNQVNPF